MKLLFAKFRVVSWLISPLVLLTFLVNVPSRGTKVKLYQPSTSVNLLVADSSAAFIFAKF
jgi:hypothetical protein